MCVGKRVSAGANVFRDQTAKPELQRKAFTKTLSAECRFAHAL